MPDIPLSPIRKTPWFPKFTECLFAAVALFNSIFMVGAILQKFSGVVLSVFFLGQLVIGVLFGLGYSLFWHSRERRNAINSDRLHAWLQAILRYWLAFAISVYGFGKVFGTQFAPSFIRSDTPVGQLSGFELTWHYFGHSYVFALLIAGTQIGGSILLLFRRTTLLGAAILLPVMMNILLINIFYHIAVGAFLNSVLFTLGLVYLIWLHRTGLIKLFLHAADYLPAVGSNWPKQGVRVLAIGGALALVFAVVQKYPHSPLEGKWTVDQLIRNHDTVAMDAWLTNTGAWRTVYIERYSVLYLCPNPYVFDRAKSLDAGYSYDSVKHRIQLFFPAFKSKDTANETVSNYDGNHMNWSGILGGDTVRLQLSRARD